MEKPRSEKFMHVENSWKTHGKLSQEDDGTLIKACRNSFERENLNLTIRELQSQREEDSHIKV